jgi:hypothetical protein
MLLCLLDISWPLQRANTLLLAFGMVWVLLAHGVCVGV